MKTTFRVSRNYPKILRNRKRRIERRLAPRHWEDQSEPMMQGSNIHYVLLPVQIIRAGRRIVYRLLGYNNWLKDFFATWQRLQKLELVE